MCWKYCIWTYSATHWTPTSIFPFVSSFLHWTCYQTMRAEQMTFKSLIGEESKLAFLTVQRRSIVNHFRMYLHEEKRNVLDCDSWFTFMNRKYICLITLTLCIHCIWFRNWSKSFMYPSQISQTTMPGFPPCCWFWPGFTLPMPGGLVNMAAACCIALAFEIFADDPECIPGCVCLGNAVIDILGCCELFCDFDPVG